MYLLNSLYRYTYGRGGKTTLMVQIGEGAYESYYPVGTNRIKRRMQAIYLSSEINKSGDIQKISFNVSQIPPITVANFTIRMKHTTLDTFVLAEWDSDWTTVYQADEDISSIGWHDIVLSSFFAYNGSDNLMVDFSLDIPATQAGGWAYYSSMANRVLHYNGGAAGAPTSWVGAVPLPNIGAALPNIKLWIN